MFYLFVSIIFNLIVSILLSGVLFYLFITLTCASCKSNVCLIGKTAIVTGGNSGIGYETVLGLAGRGCKVIIADVVDSQNSVVKAVKATGNSNIHYMHLDLAETASIRKFSKDFQQSYDQLDILVNNAGIAQSNGKFNSDAVDLCMQINYFGPFLLTHCLADVLKKSTESRVVFVSSHMAFVHHLTVNNLSEPSPTQYCKSKFCLLIAAWYFTKIFQKYNITANAVNPGMTKTNIHTLEKEFFIWRFIHHGILKLYGRTAYEGAQPVLDAAISQRWKNLGGMFLSDCYPFFKPYQYYNEQFRNDIIEKTRKIVGLGQSDDMS